MLGLAEEHLRRAIERRVRRNPNPYDGEAYYQLGLTLRYQGRVEEAYGALYKGHGTRRGAGRDTKRWQSWMGAARWLIAHGRIDAARRVLTRLADSAYAGSEIAAVQASLATEATQARAGLGELFSAAVRRPLLIGVCLAVLQQWCGINVLFNYAQEVYRDAGYGVNDILFNIVITGAINLLFTLLAMALVDRLGRRSLMLFGCLGVGIAHLMIALAYHLHLRGLPVLVFTPAAIACYAMSLAPITWVLISEIFPNRIRGLGVSVAVSALWAASFVLVYTFPIMERGLGSSGTFMSYGIICLGDLCSSAPRFLRLGIRLWRRLRLDF